MAAEPPDPSVPKEIAEPVDEGDFGKSLRNVATELDAVSLLLGDARIQIPDLQAKKRILEIIGVAGDFSTRTFDAVMTPTPLPRLTTDNLDEFMSDICLVEIKATRKAIRNETLSGFFFGATKREYDLGEAMGDRYRFAFVVLNDINDYGRPFFVLMTLAEVERRTRTKRIQYQVNLGANLDTIGVEPLFGDN